MKTHLRTLTLRSALEAYDGMVGGRVASVFGNAACGADWTSALHLTDDPDEVDCMRCRRTKEFKSKHRVTVLDDIADTMMTMEQYEVGTAKGFWEHAAVALDKWMVGHGECDRSRKLMVKVMGRTDPSTPDLPP